MDGYANGACLVGDRTRDGLADPPSRVGRELEALCVVELLDRADKTEVALLYEVEKEHAAPHVALGDRHCEAKVRADEGLLCLQADLLDAHEAPLLGTVELDLARLCGLQLYGRLAARLDLHRKVDLLGGGQ